MFSPSARPIEALSEYVDLGLCAIPLQPKDKRPAIEWDQFKTRLPTEEEVDAWSGGFPDANVGIVCGHVSGIVVVDADTPEAVEFCREYGLTSPMRVKTGRGYHYYFRSPADATRKRGKLCGRKDLQLQAESSYVVAPPSIHPSGARYVFEIEPGIDGIEDLPVFREPTIIGDVDIASLDLSDVRPLGIGHEDIFMETRSRVARDGLLKHGDGRYVLMVELVGKMMADGLDDDAVRREVGAFISEFFQPARTKEEFDEIKERMSDLVRNMRDKDRREHPERYDLSGDPVGTKATKTLPPIPKVPFYTAAEILAMSGLEVDYLVEPWLPKLSTAMVYGLPSEGKSFVTLMAMWHLAQGKSCGPWRVQAPAKVLYFDFDQGRTTIQQRIRTMHDNFGDPGENLRYFATSFVDVLFDPRSEEGVRNLLETIRGEGGQVVVLDNIRTWVPGMVETKAEEWASINTLVKRIRDEMDVSVVVVHHSNKSQRASDGKVYTGSEAGSSNALTVIETQIRVERVVKEKQSYLHRTSKRYDTDDAYEFFEAVARDSGTHYRDIFSIQYGKVRDRDSAIHTSTHLCTMRAGRGRYNLSYFPSNRQIAENLHATKKSPADIATMLQLDDLLVEQWLSEGGA